MIDDFELIVHKFNDREDRHIYLLGDVHLGAKECLETEFAKFLQTVKDDYAGYLILLGDLLNNGVKSSVIRLDAMLEDTVPLGVRFCITAAEGQSYKVLSLPVYTVNKTAKTITIDIGELIAGITLEIALPSGHITVKESK